MTTDHARPVQIHYQETSKRNIDISHKCLPHFNFKKRHVEKSQVPKIWTLIEFRWLVLNKSHQHSFPIITETFVWTSFIEDMIKIQCSTLSSKQVMNPPATEQDKFQKMSFRINNKLCIPSILLTSTSYSFPSFYLPLSHQTLCSLLNKKHNFFKSGNTILDNSKHYLHLRLLLN